MDCLCSLYLIGSKQVKRRTFTLFSLVLITGFLFELLSKIFAHNGSNTYPPGLLLVCLHSVFQWIRCDNGMACVQIDYILVSVSHSIYWSARRKPCPVANTIPRDILVIVCCLANQSLFLVIRLTGEDTTASQITQAWTFSIVQSCMKE